jgi:hypothetical protein
MPHIVKAKVQVIELAKSGAAITLQISADGNRLGDIRIGKGSFAWKSAGKQKFIKKDWTTFCNMLDRYFYGEE